MAEPLLHTLPGGFGPRSLLCLDRELSRTRPDRVLVQFVPHAFGWKGLNLPLVGWLAARPRPLWVMFHEVYYPRLAGQPWRHRLLAHGTRAMARTLARAADRLFVSTPAWADLLRELHPAARPEWLPIPSTIPPPAVRPARDPGRVVVGHFGTFGDLIAPLAEAALVELLGGGVDRVAVLVGRGGPAFADGLVRRHPPLAGRVTATGDLPPAAVGERLAGCDVLVQPFADGVTSRRTSVMAGLACGVPVVTNRGRLTEPVWDGVLTLAADAAGVAAAAEAVLARPLAGRDALGDAGRRAYEERFALPVTLAALRR